MFKQLFYIAAVVVLMIIVYRLMKKVDSNDVEDPYKVTENPNEKFLGKSGNEVEEDKEDVDDLTEEK